MKKLQLLVLAFSMLFGVIYISKTEKTDEIKEDKKTPILASNVYDSLKTGLFKISVDSTKETVEYLTSDKLEGRMSGKDGNVLAAEFIKKQFESFGYKTKYQKYNDSKIHKFVNSELKELILGHTKKKAMILQKI